MLYVRQNKLWTSATESIIITTVDYFQLCLKKKQFVCVWDANEDFPTDWLRQWINLMLPQTSMNALMIVVLAYSLPESFWYQFQNIKYWQSTVLAMAARLFWLRLFSVDFICLNKFWKNFLRKQGNLTIYEPPHDKTSKMTVRPAKTLIRLSGCQGWSECSLGRHAILLVLSWGGS